MVTHSGVLVREIELDKTDFWRRARETADRGESFVVVARGAHIKKARRACEAYQRYRRRAQLAGIAARASAVLSFLVRGLRVFDLSNLLIYTEKYHRDLSIHEEGEALRIVFKLSSSG